MKRLKFKKEEDRHSQGLLLPLILFLHVFFIFYLCMCVLLCIVCSHSIWTYLELPHTKIHEAQHKMDLRVSVVMLGLYSELGDSRASIIRINFVALHCYAPKKLSVVKMLMQPNPHCREVVLTSSGTTALWWTREWAGHWCILAASPTTMRVCRQPKGHVTSWSPSLIRDFPLSLC